jgi:hypothetical protein
MSEQAWIADRSDLEKERDELRAQNKEMLRLLELWWDGRNWGWYQAEGTLLGTHTKIFLRRKGIDV